MKKLPDFLLQEENYSELILKKRSSSAFIDKTIQKLAGLIRINNLQLIVTGKNLLISGISIRTKLILFFYFILLISFEKHIGAEAILGILIFCLHWTINADFYKTYKRILFFTFLFGFLIALPSSLNLVTQGQIVFPIMDLEHPRLFWIYQIPRIIGFTAEGLKGMCILTLRVFNSISISFLLINTTPFNDIIKGLKIFRIPDSLLMIFTLSYLYVIILSNSVLESYLSMKARIIGHMNDKEIQQLIAGRITHIFKMSKRHFEKTYLSMQARGYTGEVIFYHEEKLAFPDYLILSIAATFGIILYFI